MIEKKEIKIINYHEEFKERFRAINYYWIKKYFEIIALDKKVFGNPQKEILQKNGFIFLATYKDDIIGTIALEKISEKHYTLSKMAVEHGYQGHKIGQALIEKAIKKCIELQLDSVILYTNQVLINALNLYFKKGFNMVPLDATPYERATIKMKLKFNPEK